MASENLSVEWEEVDKQWKIKALKVKRNNDWKVVKGASGEHTILFSATKPDSTSITMHANTGVVFPEEIYRYQKEPWKAATSAVSMNTAGKAYHFFPSRISETQDGILLQSENEIAIVSAEWNVDPVHKNDIIVNQSLIAKKPGFYSTTSPSLVNIATGDITWATVPGYFHGAALQPDSVLAYAYGQGIPTFPAIYPDRCMTTPTSIADIKDSLSVAVTVEPGFTRDPWEKDQNTHLKWNTAFSHMSRKGVLSPTLYYPVLGEKGSKLAAGDTLKVEFRFSVRNGYWMDNLDHAINDVYQFSDKLKLRRNQTSLTKRIEAMHSYLTDPKTSMWNLEEYEGRTIGAQSYLGGVVGSQGDAMKNADYGAMWMLGKATGDLAINEKVLPYARNFKLVQQEDKPGFFNGAAMGQYYLAKRKTFVEEWGDFIEPISLTYYTMLDLGNILLFQPEDQELHQRLRHGAELLLKWQHEDGYWEVAYDRKTKQPLFKDIKDLRPTFYGLVVAYRILKDERYLAGAIKGADWLIEHSVNKGHFIGVCGDARYAPDFATAQTAQVLLDLFDITGNEKYKAAAIAAARIYTTSVYTHPVPSTVLKTVKDNTREDWEISQAGLSFEHGGIMGSAQRHGPIQLASHAGLFVRMFNITGDSLFITMARAAAIGRDAFLDNKTKVASYYWNAMGRGAGPYPHHAWWQIGWIMDYLMAEAELRSAGKIIFPRGFVTPKVGPHQSYGFETGNVFGEKAKLIISKAIVDVDNPNIEYILAESVEKDVFIILLNDVGEKQSVTLKLFEKERKISAVHDVTGQGQLEPQGTWQTEIDPYGLKVFRVTYQ
ncbi:glycerophosphoryl diester phosphodiesterase [Chryseolinea sp. H1M3-3]|uniref:glycerophosphoryl diester phosphodiesterase n=1 Tax=Chryseolinea sp. H1M3-3 TaxID=3034144 RepID=UPI0023ED9249|nr:glycerophosphoryl diester phosphodiesterase [Chryseolinea sp. H1M3-3]